VVKSMFRAAWTEVGTQLGFPFRGQAGLSSFCFETSLRRTSRRAALTPRRAPAMRREEEL
jgi:hypothetical protein